MAKTKGSTKQDSSAAKDWKPSKRQIKRCIGEVCFNEDGEIIVDLTKHAKSCPLDLRQRIAEYYAKGGIVNMKMPLPKPPKKKEAVKER